VQKEARITSKGQVTIPRDIRRELGVQAGDRVVFETDDAGVRVRPVRKESVFAKYRGTGHPGIPSGRAAINRWIREMRGE
jgi:antitoxin PrlF